VLLSRLTLAKVITLAVLSVFLILTAYSFNHTVNVQYAADKAAMIDQLQRNLAILGRNSERLLKQDPAMLKENFSQLAGESHVLQAAIIDENERIWISNQYDKLHELVIKAYDPDRVSFIRRARETRLLQIDERVVNNTKVVWIAMSFSAPQDSHSLRNTERGVIFFSCNADKIYQEASASAISVALSSLPLLLVLTLILLFTLHGLVTRPIRAVTSYATAENTHLPLTLSHAPTDLQALADAISRMRQDLSAQLTQIKEEGALNRLILENTNNGFITIDTKGVIQSASPPAEKMFGYKESELKGQNVSILMPPPLSEEHGDYLKAYQHTHQPRILGQRRETRGLRKNGESFPLELRVEEIHKNQQPLFVGSVRDLTERVALDRAKNEFVSTVSHELRTPLTAINGAVGLILGTAGPDLPENVAHLLAVAQRNGDRLLQLINDLLDMEKLLAGKMPLHFETVSVHELVVGSIELLKPMAGQLGKHLVAGISQVPTIRIDPHRFQQALTNLVSNALKYSGDTPDVHVDVVHQDGHVMISVRDQGPGIPESFHEKLFTKFAQVDASNTRQTGGTGLGLAITKQLVEQMGGQIHYRAELPSGTRFDMVFPIADPDAST
jgi:PAS domain S-box-containing protein